MSDAYDRAQGAHEAHVTVASALDSDQQRRIALALGRKLGGTVRLDVSVDEKILGGFVARVGSRVIDASIASAGQDHRLGIR